MDVEGILRTKLYPPRLPAIVKRVRLQEELNKARSARLIDIVAGAGYGKSTLAMEFLKEQRAPFVWYHLEEPDQDLPVFVSYLIAGIRMEYGGFGEKSWDRLQSAENIQIEKQAILSTLLSEMDELIKDDFFIVLDDFHHLNDSPMIIESLDFMLGHLPSNIHFMILSRAKPGLDLAELAAYRELVELGEADLSFSSDEAGRLFSDVFDRSLDVELMEALARITEGWVSGLVLFHLAFRGKEADDIENAIREFGVAPARLSEYLSRAVYDGQDDEVKDFLARSSILERMNPDYCDELLGIDGSRRILTLLTREGLFTIPLDDMGEWYRYHHLLKTFLLDMLAECRSPQEIDDLNRAAAALWEKCGEEEEALRHYMEAREYEKAAGILLKLSPGLVEAGRMAFVNRHLKSLPQETMDRYPELVYNLATTWEWKGAYQEELEGYRRAISLFEAAGDVERQTQVLYDLARLLFSFVGKADEGWELISKVREIASESSAHWYEVSAFLSFMAIMRGQTELGGQLWAETMAHINEIASVWNRSQALYFCAWVPYLGGDYTRTCEIMYQACRIDEEMDIKIAWGYHYHLLSLALCRLGRFAEALRYADKGLSFLATLEWGAAFDSLNRSVKALALALMGQRGAALHEVGMASSSTGEYGEGSLVLLLDNTIAEVYAICGDRSSALEYFTVCERNAEVGGLHDGLILYRTWMIWLTRGERGMEEARDEVEAMAESLHDTRGRLCFVPICLMLALLNLATGRRKEASETLDKVSSDQGSLIYWKEIWLGMVDSEETVDQFLPLVYEMFSRGDYLDFWSCALETIGPASLPYLERLEKDGKPQVRERAAELAEAISREAAVPLRISMLGPFAIMRGEERIADEEWKSKKALSVLKYMAANLEKRLVPREVLMDLLWPESDPESASKNLNMALTSLRKTLEPASPRGKSSYILSSGESLYLELGDGGWIDTALFGEKLNLAKDSKAAGKYDPYLAVLHQAEKLYRGDFLEEDLYEDWCRGKRDSLKEMYHQLLRDIYKEYLRRGEYADALRYTEKAIVADPGREGLYRGQMEIYAKTGDRVGIERAFQRCSDYLKENFDVSPSRETEELYHRLRRE